MKKLSAIICAIVMTMSLAACGGNDSSDGSVKDDSSSNSVTEPEVTQPEVTEPIIEDQPVNLEEGPTEAMMTRAILNEGNTERLKALINSCKDKESITVAYIGGSITQGSSATKYENNYVSLTSAWIEENLGVTVNIVNAGIGATDSYIGVHRVEADVIAHNPDLVFVEFAVNDTNVEKNTASYDSLLYKLLTSESSPAVISLIMTQENGTSLTAVHEAVAKHYDVPIISYREVVYPEVVAGNLLWTDISPDNIHPNDAGHKLLSQLIQNYLTDVIADAEGFGTEASAAEYTAYAGNIYADAQICNRDSDKVVLVSEGEFTKTEMLQSFVKGWGCNAANASVTFEIEGKNIGIIYKKTTNGKNATANVYIDDQLIDVLDGDFTGGWGNYAESQILLTSDESAVHTVRVELTGDKEQFQILSWLVS